MPKNPSAESGRAATRADSSAAHQSDGGIRVVHITTIPESLNFLKGQVGFMVAHGFNVAAISSPGTELDAFAAREGVPAYAVAMARRITPLQDLISTWRIYRVLRRVRPHIVHAQTPKGGLLGTIAAWLAGTPVRIYHIRGLPFMGATGVRRALLRVTERIACVLSHSVLCVSHSVRDVAVAEGLCAPGKITVLLGGSGNGVDAEGRFNPRRDPSQREATRASLGISPDATVIGFVGRVVRDKGVVELATAWSALRERHPNAHLFMVGPFEPQDPIPADVEALLRGDPRVHLAGHVRETSAFYSAMDLVVLPTYREGFPNVPLEAASMELPIVATRIPGCIDAVQDGTTGALVPARDSAALATAIDAYLRDSGLRRAHGQAGRVRVLREFRQEAIWEALRAHYATWLAARGFAVAVTTGVPAGDVPGGLHDRAPTAEDAFR